MADIGNKITPHIFQILLPRHIQKQQRNRPVAKPFETQFEFPPDNLAFGVIKNLQLGPFQRGFMKRLAKISIFNQLKNKLANDLIVK